jgi:hypothetical protein
MFGACVFLLLFVTFIVSSEHVKIMVWINELNLHVCVLQKEPMGAKVGSGMRASTPMNAPSRQVTAPIRAPAASLGASSLASSTSVNSEASISLPSSVASSTSPQPQAKRSAKDFIFGKVIGEGSFSTVGFTLRSGAVSIMVHFNLHMKKNYTIYILLL